MGNLWEKYNITKTKLQNSNAKRDYDAWIARNYDGLLKYAKRYHSCPNDLLHHVYLKVRELNNLQEIVSGKPWGYHILAMFRQAKMSTFGKQYKILDHPVVDQADERNDVRVIKREEVDLVLRQLDFFDRAVYEVRLEGISMTQLARESGISVHTIYYSIRKTNRILKNKLC